MKKSDIGLIGLAVMGQNLALNLENKGYSVSVYNRSTLKTKKFIDDLGKNKNIIPSYCLREFVSQLKKPRKIIIMIKVGDAIDNIINELMPLIEENDIIIDGGNSHFLDTERRQKHVESKGFLYIGAGVSGGEAGALTGPSIMPGGSYLAWKHVKPILQDIAAKVNQVPCCDWIGPGGAGHFVKMVHNGIEYGEMQLICEAYHIMRDIMFMSTDEIHSVFYDWNTGELKSYLIGITSDILKFKNKDKQPLINKILDVAGQKGCGKWLAIEGMDKGIVSNLVSEAVYARYLSTLKDERKIASDLLKGPKPKSIENKESFILAIKDALIASEIINYTQGFNIMQNVSSIYAWELDFIKIASIWSGGSILYGEMLNNVRKAFEKNSKLLNLLVDNYFCELINEKQLGLRMVCSFAAQSGIPIPTMFSALSFYDAYRCDSLPFNLLQAQRDYFGSHKYERVDYPRGQFFHTNWTGNSRDTTSTVYNV